LALLTEGHAEEQTRLKEELAVIGDGIGGSARI
jgi:hypothetical protein